MLYPFRFQPLFRRYLWGGRRLQTMLQKPIGPGEDYAESWEIVDHGADQSIVSNGSRAGQSLHDLVDELGPRLLGAFWDERIHDKSVPLSLRGRFPLLLKFLDARLPLSVQVHPDDEMGTRLSPADLGKTEAWLVLATGPQSRIYAGLNPDVDRQRLADAINDGSIESMLHSFAPRAGDCVFIPAGTVHAIGGELLICEIQQASDTTFRLYDWNRVDASGKARPLHVPRALEAINFQRGPIEPIRWRVAINGLSEPLVTCDKFYLNRIVLDEPMRRGGDGRMRILVVVKGSLQLEYEQGNESLELGQCVLLPADGAAFTLNPKNQAALFEIRLPDE